MELTFPLLSAWVLGTPRLTSFAFGAAAVLGFLAHEPLMLLLGKRGARRKREEGRAALWHLLVLGTLAAAAAGLGLATAAPTVRLLLLVPAVLSTVTLLLALAGRERNAGGELLVALTLSSIALPVAGAAGLAPATSATVVGVWIVGFAVGTFAARGVLLRQRDGGQRLRHATWLAIAAGVGCGVVATLRLVTPPIALGPLPFVTVALALRLRPPPPQRMTAIGLTLVAASTVTLVMLTLADVA